MPDDLSVGEAGAFDHLPARPRAIAEGLAKLSPAAARRYAEGEAARLNRKVGMPPPAPTQRYEPAPRVPAGARRVEFELSARAFKIAVVLDAAQFAGLSVPDGTQEVGFSVTAEGHKLAGRLNAKTTRRALARLAEIGAENAAVVLQGKLAGRELTEAGITVQPKNRGGGEA